MVRSVEGSSEILKAASVYFHTIYYSSKEHSSNLDDIDAFLEDVSNISPKQKALMDSPVTLQDLRGAPGSMRDSVPGPVGFPYSFYKKYQDKLLPILRDTWEECCAHGKLTDKMRCSLIAFLPKPGKDARNINNLRPIILTNTVIKRITKAITNKINLVLPSIFFCFVLFCLTPVT